MKTILGIRRLEETLRRSGGSGDNWHMTCARDGRQFVVMGDGKGWPDVAGYTGQTYDTRVYGLHGDPPDLEYEHLHGYPDLVSGKDPQQSRYYGGGILAIDDHIYHFLSAQNRSSDPPARFVGAKLIYSPDQGRTWKNQAGSPVYWENEAQRTRENMVFFDEPGEAFSLVSLLQMGRNYEDNSDGYVYGYAPAGNHEEMMNHLVLFRVPQTRILHRSEYEFFVSCNHDGAATWSKDIGDRGVVHTFAQCRWPWTCWRPSIVYNAPLGVFMMANWGMGQGAEAAGGDNPAYLGFWLAEHPWGPWRLVHEETEWTPLGDPRAQAYQPQISPKWIAGDGRSFWLVYTDFQSVDGGLPYYCFNYQKVEILTA
ncbi:MAG: hypothetical protein QGG05_06925 [Candidatus Latescibacteria bacterium]|nr:hypothetical protein [Candidatus Latescibacterota bacterium]MEE3264007.1 hypothetical protein [Candidatus Latescibacterota bacterium]